MSNMLKPQGQKFGTRFVALQRSSTSPDSWQVQRLPTVSAMSTAAVEAARRAMNAGGKGQPRRALATVTLAAYRLQRCGSGRQLYVMTVGWRGCGDAAC